MSPISYQVSPSVHWSLIPRDSSPVSPLGKEHLPIIDTNYGKVSGAICFDVDFPQYIVQAGRQHVDLFLQPSWTWNAYNFRHFESDALRSIENGFTLLRCGSDGESGITDPQGKFLHRKETNHDPSIITLFELPLRKHSNPMYPFIGFIFEYLCIIGSFYYIVTSVIGVWLVSKRKERVL